MARPRQAGGPPAPRSIAARLVAGALLALALLAVPARAGGDDAVAALAATLPEKAQGALARIDARGRRLLALKAYLRSARSLDARWSWTEAEIAAYVASPAHAEALDAVAAVTKAFEEKNPGYSLYVNTNVRSLDEQIAKWNRNASVGAAAEELEAAFADWSKANEKAGEAKLRAFLAGFRPEATVAIAAPGLSPHGRARAFDFQVARQGAILVAASTKIIEEVWDEDGWTEKLRQAVKASGMPFEGPLERPREPWHYEYAGPGFDPSKPPELARADGLGGKPGDLALPAVAPLPQSASREADDAPDVPPDAPVDVSLGDAPVLPERAPRPRPRTLRRNRVCHPSSPPRMWGRGGAATRRRRGGELC